MVAHEPGQPVPAQLKLRLCTVQPEHRPYINGSFHGAGSKVWLEPSEAERLEHNGVVAIDERPFASVKISNPRIEKPKE